MIMFEAKLVEGGKLVINEKNVIVSRGHVKTVIPIHQVSTVGYLPWSEDNYAFLETASGISVVFKAKDKEKIKDEIQKAQMSNG